EEVNHRNLGDDVEERAAVELAVKEADDGAESRVRRRVDAAVYARIDPAEHDAGKKHQGLREDDGHHAAMIHAERKVLALSAVNPPAAGVLGLLDGNAPLRLRDQDRATDHEDKRQ